MKQSLFETRHQQEWQRFEQRLTALEQGKADVRGGETFPGDYRRLCHHLALAQERGYSSHLVDPCISWPCAVISNFTVTAALPGCDC